MHLDGQPVDPKKWNQENPFIPVYKIKDNESFIDYDSNKIADIDYKTIEDKDIRIFARASSDAKGPVMMLIQALKFMNSNNINQKLNLKLVMDFEEEKGSPSLPEAVKKHSSILKSDALLIFDGPQHVTDLPTLNFGNRGISSITLKTYGPIVPQHSGHFGNYAPNPVFRMSNILSSMKDENGVVKIKGYYDGIEISDQVKKYLDNVPDDEESMLNKMQFKKPESVGLESSEVDKIMDYIKTPSLNTQAAILIKGNSIVSEFYADGYDKDDLVTSWSVAKSFSSTIIGIAIDEGYINSVDDSIALYLPKWNKEPQENISLKYLLAMRSGMDDHPGLGVYFQSDMASYSLDRAISREPGILFSYSNEDSMLLGRIIENATGLNFQEYADTRLFDKLNINETWWTDKNGNTLTYAGLDMTPREFAKFGLMIAPVSYTHLTLPTKRIV